MLLLLFHLLKFFLLLLLLLLLLLILKLIFLHLHPVAKQRKLKREISSRSSLSFIFSLRKPSRKIEKCVNVATKFDKVLRKYVGKMSKLP